VGDRRFGLSTHLFHDHRLTRDHLALVAKHGFDAVEVFATRTHFDYRDENAVAQLGGWLRETRLELHSVHAPIAEAVRRGEMVVPYSTASGDETREFLGQRAREGRDRARQNISTAFDKAREQYERAREQYQSTMRGTEPEA